MAIFNTMTVKASPEQLEGYHAGIQSWVELLDDDAAGFVALGLTLYDLVNGALPTVDEAELYLKQLNTFLLDYHSISLLKEDPVDRPAS